MDETGDLALARGSTVPRRSVLANGGAHIKLRGPGRNGASLEHSTQRGKTTALASNNPQKW